MEKLQTLRTKTLHLEVMCNKPLVFSWDKNDEVLRSLIHDETVQKAQIKKLSQKCNIIIFIQLVKVHKNVLALQ